MLYEQFSIKHEIVENFIVRALLYWIVVEYDFIIVNFENYKILY